MMRFGLLVLALLMGTGPTFAQIGNPDTQRGTLSGDQIGPGGAPSETTGAAPGFTPGPAPSAIGIPSPNASGVPSGDLGAFKGDPPDQVPLGAPKGHIGGN